VIRGIRQRRRLKHELTAEAARLAPRLVELRQRLAAAERQTITQLDVLSTEAPSCPRCGATLMVRTAKKKRFNGASFWGCPRYERCGQGVIPLETYPRRGIHRRAAHQEGEVVKSVELPPEAEEQLAEFRALAAEAERVVASAQAQLREIAKQGEVETERAREVVHAMIDDKLVAAELVAEAWADCELATARARAQVLRAKATPAKGAADEVRAKGKELAALRREAKYTQWVLKLYEWHFPWLADLRDDDEARAYLGQPAEPTEADPKADPVSHWLTPEEFAKLSEGERNQRALDRYLVSRKSPWELGRDYERYIGYLREQAGWAVTYQGIFEGSTTSDATYSRATARRSR